MTDAYLTSLRHAVRDLPKPIGDEIVAGVREELRGLDDADARSRIAELGDPQFIAASAREEVPPKRQDAGWYTVLTIVLIAVGGIIVPVVGWFVGIAMLWWSRTWTLRDKLIGTLVLPVVLAVSLLVGVLASASTGQESLLSNDGGFPTVEAINPLVPFGFAHSSIIIAFVIAPIISSIYLAVRARRLRSIQQP